MSLQDLVKDRIPEGKLHLVPKGFEVIGDIAIINTPQSLREEKYIIAETLMSHRKDVRVVLQKVHKVQGSARVGIFELLVGNRTTTVHRENGCIFQVDLARTYFTGKMAYERDRVAQKAIDGESVLVLFSGVGPFLIPIKKKRNVDITGLDNNPQACTFLKKNVELNDIEAGIILADANSVNALFKKHFDRIVMPAPYGQDHFLNPAKSVLEPGGMVHFYTFKKDFEIPHFKRLLEKKGWKIDFYRNCGGAAPRVSRYVFDLQKPYV